MVWRALVLVVLAGCGDDSAVVMQSDDRVWMPIDAGIPPRPEAGPDTGEAGVRECYAPPSLAGLLPRCRAATRECVVACPEGDAGEACRSACWAADDFPRSDPPERVACSDCIYSRLIGCVDAAGCHPEVAALYCCIVEQCSGQDACINEMCMPQLVAMYVCGYASEPACFDVVGGDVGQCYATSDPDGGSPDGGGDT